MSQTTSKESKASKPPLKASSSRASVALQDTSEDHQTSQSEQAQIQQTKAEEIIATADRLSANEEIESRYSDDKDEEPV